MSNTSNMTYSQKKRSQMDYRKAYFEHNPGLFGCVWICAYCHKPILGRRNVQVDHVMPLNNMFGRNARYNLVAACPTCNKKKSDKVDGRVIEGYLSKLIEVILFTVQKLIVGAVVAVWTGIINLFKLLKTALLLPLRKTKPVVKIIYVAALVLVAAFVFIHLSGGLNVLSEL